MSVQRLDELLKKLDNLEDIPGGVLRVSVAREIQKVAAVAKMKAPGYTGELRNSIHGKSEVIEGGVRGTCYTAKKYAVYVELGTGPKGEQNHGGISPVFSPVYVQEPWWIHESQIDRKDAEFYRWPYIDTKEGRFYKCSGQAAHPFMYPALKSYEDAIASSICTDVRMEIRKVTRKV